jgi:hypothetical protein
VRVIDQRSIVSRLRVKVYKEVEKRWVSNDHWRYAIRRAANRAGLPITKRSIRFASDALKNTRDWTCGVDVVEFALTKMPEQFSAGAMEQFEGELSGMRVLKWQRWPLDASPLRSEVDLSLYELEVAGGVEEGLAHLRAWEQADHVSMLIREVEWGRSLRQEVNAKSYVPDLWLVRDGARLMLRMLVRGHANPYEVWAALYGARTWAGAARYPVVRLEAFVEQDESLEDFFRPSCEGCGRAIPIDLLEEPYDTLHCPKCDDRDRGALLEGVSA